MKKTIKEVHIHLINPFGSFDCHYLGCYYHHIIWFGLICSRKSSGAKYNGDNHGTWTDDADAAGDHSDDKDDTVNNLPSTMIVIDTMMVVYCEWINYLCVLCVCNGTKRIKFNCSERG